MRNRILIIALTLLSATAFAARLRQVALIDLPGAPGFDDVAIANGCLLIAHTADNSVDIFDLARRSVIAQVKHVRGASGIAVDEKNGRVYLSSPDAHSIVVLSTESWDVQGVIPVKTDVDRILLVPGANRLYLANSNDQTISYLDLAHNSDIHTVDAGGTPRRLVFDPAKKVIYATLEDKHAIAAYDLNLKPVSQWVLKASQPTGLALDAKARRLYVAVRHAVITFDPDSGQELSRIGAPAGVDSLWLDAASHTVYAAGGGSVSILKTRPNGLTHDVEVNIDVKGHTLAFDPERKLVYVPGGRDGRSKLLIMKQFEGKAVAFRDKHGKATAEGN